MSLSLADTPDDILEELENQYDELLQEILAFAEEDKDSDDEPIDEDQKIIQDQLDSKLLNEAEPRVKKKLELINPQNLESITLQKMDLINQQNFELTRPQKMQLVYRQNLELITPQKLQSINQLNLESINQQKMELINQQNLEIVSLQKLESMNHEKVGQETETELHLETQYGQQHIVEEQSVSITQKESNDKNEVKVVIEVKVAPTLAQDIMTQKCGDVMIVKTEAKPTNNNLELTTDKLGQKSENKLESILQDNTETKQIEDELEPNVVKYKPIEAESDPTIEDELIMQNEDSEHQLFELEDVLERDIANIIAESEYEKECSLELSENAIYEAIEIAMQKNENQYETTEFDENIYEEPQQLQELDLYVEEHENFDYQIEEISDQTVLQKSENQMQEPNNQIQEAETQIQISDDQMQESEDQIQASDDQIQESEHQIQASDDQIQESENQIQPSDDQIQESGNEIQPSNDQVQESEDQTQESENPRQELDISILKLPVSINQSNSPILQADHSEHQQNTTPYRRRKPKLKVRANRTSSLRRRQIVLKQTDPNWGCNNILNDSFLSMTDNLCICTRIYQDRRGRFKNIQDRDFIVDIPPPQEFCFNFGISSVDLEENMARILRQHLR